MTNTAQLTVAQDVQPEHAAVLAAPEPSDSAVGEIPAIQPRMAELLELTRSTDGSLTPKEINAQLDRVLRDYDELTALYADNNRRIDATLSELRQAGGEVSSQVHRLAADLQQQSLSLSSHATASERQIATLRGETQNWLADTAHGWEARFTSSNARASHEVERLDSDIAALAGLFKAQEQIIAEQRRRLDQFDVTCELLDTATRGNRSRIEAVREQAEKQHTIVEARIDGLGALQREHYTEFQSLQGLVGVLRAETQRLDSAIGEVATALASHAGETRDGFRKTHLAIAGLLLLTLAGFALVKWAPAFAPASTEALVAKSEARMAEVGTHLAALAAGEETRRQNETEQQARIALVTDKVADLEKSLGELRAALANAPALGNGPRVLHDRQWLLQQSPKAYTVQLVLSPSQADMARFVDRNIRHLARSSLAFAATEYQQREHYSLFLGAFDTVGQARAAIAALPPDLRANQPWVRQFQSIQASLH